MSKARGKKTDVKAEVSANDDKMETSDEPTAKANAKKGKKSAEVHVAPVDSKTTAEEDAQTEKNNKFVVQVAIGAKLKYENQDVSKVCANALPEANRHFELALQDFLAKYGDKPKKIILATELLHVLCKNQ
jgi:hypothetical protein